MNFRDYVEKQKKIIKMQAFLATARQQPLISPTEQLFFELAALDGLNVRERERYARLARTKKQ